MTKKNLPFPELAAQERQVSHTTAILEQIVDTLNVAKPDESDREKASRYRMAAVLATRALGDLWTMVGWCEGAVAADRNGLLEGK